MINLQQNYRCVYCSQNTVVMTGNQILCKECRSSFPVIDEIPILAKHPYQVAAVQAEGLRDVRKRLLDLRGVYQHNKSIERQITFQGTKKIIDAISANIGLIDEHCAPILKFVEKQHLTFGIADWAAVQGGWGIDELLPYFYQDWYGTKQFSIVCQHFESAMHLCEDRGALVVLGAGACGLAHHLSRYFEQSTAVDIAMPALMLAKHLMDGNTLTFHLEQARWEQIKLSAPLTHPHKLEFVVADAMNTPFQESSVSAVVTQYMLDFIPNVEWFMDEVRRILKPKGVWINFSNPFFLPTDIDLLGTRRLPELSTILTNAGFKEIQLNSVRFPWLSLEGISDEGVRIEHEVHMFVASKSEKSLAIQNSSIVKNTWIQQNYVWDLVPQLVDHRTVSVTQKRSFTKGGIKSINGIEVRGKFIPLEDKFLLIVSAFFEGVDGERTLREVRNDMLKQGVEIPDQEFLKFVHALYIENFVINLNNHGETEITS